MSGRRLVLVVGGGVFVGVALIVGTTLYLSDLRGRISEQHTTIVQNQRTQCPEKNPDPARCRGLLERLLRYGTVAQRRALTQAATAQGRALPGVSPVAPSRGVSRAPTVSKGPTAGTHPPTRRPSTGTPPSAPLPSSPIPTPAPMPNLVQQLLNGTNDVVHRVTCPLLGC